MFFGVSHEVETISSFIIRNMVLYQYLYIWQVESWLRSTTISHILGCYITPTRTTFPLFLEGVQKEPQPFGPIQYAYLCGQPSRLDATPFGKRILGVMRAVKPIHASG